MLSYERYRRYLPVLLLAVVIGTTSCFAVAAGGAAGAGGFAYYKGKLVRTYSKPVEKCYRASLSAIKKLGLPILKESKDAFGASIESQMSDGKAIYINIKGVTDKTTEISVRISLFGDEEKSARILATIEQYL